MSAADGGAPPDIPGLEFAGRLGSGGYSDVYLYEQRMPRRKVAVKVLRNEGLTETTRRQFTAEANAMAELADHPNIVSVFTAEVTGDGRPYLVMTYYPRDNLGVRASRERFAVSEVLKIGIQIASAVETAHHAGILHRDIKPANILTNQYGTVGLTDFGIAAQVVAADDDDDDDTGVSVPWSPPEVLYASAPASVQSDVYSLGATLWHLLVGRSPFEVTGDGDNSAYALMRRARDQPVPSTGRADVPTSMERLLSQAMSKDPAARPPSALDFARSLQAVEQELRLPRTEIVILSDDEPAARKVKDPSPGVPDVNATRMRTPVRVDAQPPPATPSAPSSERWVPPPVSPVGSPTGRAAEPETVNRPSTVPPRVPVAPPIKPAARGGSTERPSPSPPSGTPSKPSVPGTHRDISVSDAAGATVRRQLARPAAPPAGTSAEDARRRGLHPLVVAAVMVGVLALAVVIGVLVTSGHSKSSASPDTSISSDAVGPDDPGPPGHPQITAAPLGSDKVEFSWKYPGQLDSDFFLWRYENATDSTKVDVPKVDVPTNGAQPVCIQVKVQRRDGSHALQDWSEPATCYP